ncbi:hypothetical protein V2G26_006893 [Clonostachys chloroleuca]
MQRRTGEGSKTTVEQRETGFCLGTPARTLYAERNLATDSEQIDRAAYGHFFHCRQEKEPLSALRILACSTGPET